MAAQKLRLAAVAGFVLVLLAGLGIVVIATKPPLTAGGPVDAVAAPGQSKRTVQFADGSVVELLGIQAARFDGKWWNADGLEIPAPPHPDQPRINMTGGDGTRTLRIMLRLSNPVSVDHGLKLDVVPSERTDYSSYGGDLGRGQLIEAMALVADSATSANIQIGVSHGLWTVDTTYDVSTGQYSPSGGEGFHVGNIVEQGGETSVEILDAPDITTKKDNSVVVMAGGQQLRIAHGTGKGLQRVLYFKCAKKDITAVISRSREYEIRTINNLSLTSPASLVTTAP